jgi:hypothetical protein
MKKLATVLMLTLIAAAAQAGVIADIQQGVYAEGDLVTVTDAIVTADGGNGVFITETPVGPYSGIWVYTDSDHGLMAGDVVTVTGQYIEYYDLSEISVPDAGEDGAITVTDQTEVPAPYDLTAAEYLADQEAFESVMICITDGMQVTEAPNQYGEWVAAEWNDPSLEIVFDDLLGYDDTTVEVGQCYNWACGVVYYSFGQFKLEAFVDGIEVVECTVPVEGNSLTELKGLFR